MDDNTFRNRGKIFDDDDAARCYAFRPAYPPDLFDMLLQRVRGRSKLLDLGTGNGKIAGALAPHFAQVTAVDPSRTMLDAARCVWPLVKNIDWVCGPAEDAPLAGPYDLVTAGASIHWMDPAIIFPKLRKCIADDGLIAIIVGDLASDPQWQEEWTEFVQRWAARLGDPNSPDVWHRNYAAHESWMTEMAKATFAQQVTQSVDDFVECQHSRASWARHRMGEAASGAFDAEIRDLLAPFTLDGKVTYPVATNLTTGRPSLINLGDQ